MHSGFWWRNLTETGHLDIPRHRRKNKIKRDLKETGCEG